LCSIAELHCTALISRSKAHVGSERRSVNSPTFIVCSTWYPLSGSDVVGLESDSTA